MHSLFFFFLWKKKILERNNLGKKEFTLTPSLNMICLVRAGTAAGAGHVACTAWGWGQRDGCPCSACSLFIQLDTPAHGGILPIFMVCLPISLADMDRFVSSTLTKLAPQVFRYVFRSPPSLSRLPTLFLSSLFSKLKHSFENQ